uniref:Uncharacterized protein n=1 Tax=Serinus canaria TaxID=9135 RepID=A0A8C9MTZ0_SERCA
SAQKTSSSSYSNVMAMSLSKNGRIWVISLILPCEDPGHQTTFPSDDHQEPEKILHF